MVRNVPEGPKPESLHDQLVYYLWNGERLRLRDIPELAPRWLEILTEMGGLPDTEQPRRPETGSKTDKTGTSVSPDVYITLISPGARALFEIYSTLTRTGAVPGPIRPNSRAATR
jgi:hypothetical protein